MKASQLSVILGFVSITLGVVGLALFITPTAWALVPGVLAVPWLAFWYYIGHSKRKGRLKVTGGAWLIMAHQNMKDSYVWMVDLTLTNTSEDALVSVTRVTLEIDREVGPNHVILVDSKVRETFDIPESSGATIGQNVSLGPQKSITGRMNFFDPIGPATDIGATLTIVDSQGIVHYLRRRGHTPPTEPSCEQPTP